jgi:hypothetical protein
VAGDLKQELVKLHDEGATLARLLRTRKEKESFESGYQCWYSKALPMLKALGPDRLAKFKGYYETDLRRKWLDHDTWAIQDYLTGNRVVGHIHCEFDVRRETRRCLAHQLAILRSLTDRLDWRLADIEDELLVRLLASELAAARGTLGQNVRAAGALAGVVQETYLKRLVRKHRVKVTRKTPRPRDLGDALREAGIFDAQVWSQVSWLADVRDLCSDESDLEPKPMQVRDLIDGTGWLIKNVF